MARSKRRTCSKLRCHEEPYRMGLCKKHHDEKVATEVSRAEGETLLRYSTVDDEPLGTQGLVDELTRLRRYWHDACFAWQEQRGVGVIPKDEAEYAVEWCIRIASGIVDDERSARRNPDAKGTEWGRADLWERFENLEKGLRSNGLPRG